MTTEERKMVVAGYQVMCEPGHPGDYTVKIDDTDPLLLKLYCPVCRIRGWFRLQTGRILSVEDLR